MSVCCATPLSQSKRYQTTLFTKIMHSSEPKEHFTVNKIIVLAKMSAQLGLEPRPLASKPVVLPIKLLRPNSKVLLAVAQNNKRTVPSEPVGGSGCVQRWRTCTHKGMESYLITKANLAAIKMPFSRCHNSKLGISSWTLSPS